MARNLKMEDWTRRSVVVTHPAVPVSGDPVRVGTMTGVALTNEGAGGNPADTTTVDFGNRSWNLSVRGVDGGGNSAVAFGDKLFYVDADSPPISKKATGTFFGYAAGAVGGGATATIEVMHSLD